MRRAKKINILSPDCSLRLAIRAKHEMTFRAERFTHRALDAITDQMRRGSAQSAPAGSGEQLGQVRGADGLDQVPLDPGLAREFATGMLTVSRQGNQSQGL